MKRQRNRQLTFQRLILGLIGAVLTALAVIGLLISANIVDHVSSWADNSGPLLNSSLDAELGRRTVWFQIGALVVGAAFIGLGAIWLRHQIPPIRHQQSHHFPNTSSDVEGSNVVDGGALAGALAEDLERHPSVDRAVVELRSDDDLVRLQISAADNVGVAELRSSVIDPAIARMSTAGEFDEALTTLTDVRFIEPSRSVA